MMRVRRLIAKSWWLSRLSYWLRGVPLEGRAHDAIWYFAYGANMHDSVFQGSVHFHERSKSMVSYRAIVSASGKTTSCCPEFMSTSSHTTTSAKLS